jgi:hypothetical protein
VRPSEGYRTSLVASKWAASECQTPSRPVAGRSRAVPAAGRRKVAPAAGRRKAAAWSALPAYRKSFLVEDLAAMAVGAPNGTASNRGRRSAAGASKWGRVDHSVGSWSSQGYRSAVLVSCRYPTELRWSWPRTPQGGRTASRSRFGVFLVTQAQAIINRMPISVGYEGVVLVSGPTFLVKSVSGVWEWYQVLAVILWNRLAKLTVIRTFRLLVVASVASLLLPG